MKKRNKIDLKTILNNDATRNKYIFSKPGQICPGS